MLLSAPANWSNIRFSPDGTRIAMDINDGAKDDVYVYDSARDTLTRLTIHASANNMPLWTPDGRRIVFRSTRDGGFNIYWQRADGAGDVQRLTVSDGRQLQMAGSWHPSGKFLAFAESADLRGADLMILPMEGDESSGWKPGKPFVFVTGGGAVEPMFSPD